ncbi:NAD(P)-dependent dehydrogenase (short-subunit alcohol dehydrogenase family) [Tahibacter aquaticus]|uniref:NAD(P)-dependent dehydrogenase (Short-subunit alcohol dehydrogenase family) n=1 Tax=Tahibacter aquaticus TaxID=520092 RepID=A0A4R6Z7B3_9GAMM|nr:SDR family oxidoreductase [Tahibacter aquaticus]TDR47681.1 NAD(P)-dependent dehydrogenase (short-subunit alcohol dehydrogenase family) [Tahibacter aquaticus]
MSVAIVTGANRGLGLELVQQLLQRDWRVIAGCRKTDVLRMTELAGAHPGHLHVMPLDVSSERSIAAFVNEAQMVTRTLDLLVNNAGVLIAGERYGEVAAKSLAQSFAVNASGALLLTQACSELLRAAGSARVANISTVMASLALTDTFRTPSYAMSKAALNMATRLLAAELAPHGIVVTSFHPGWVQTDMGGSQAPLAIADAVTRLLERILRMDAADAGRFIGSDEDQELPW